MGTPLLLPKSHAHAARTLNPVFDIDGEQVVMVTQFMAAVLLKALGEAVDSAGAHTLEVTAALDCLFSGV